jgi:hypothetical protein
MTNNFESELHPSEALLLMRIDEILYYVWDPLKVRLQPRQRYAYKTLLMPVFRLTCAGDSEGLQAFLLDSARALGVEPAGNEEKVSKLLLEHITLLSSELAALEEKMAAEFKPKVLTIRITLLGSEPAIWRRFEVSNEIGLDDLHDVIQAVMGWEDCHLHEFVIKKKRYTGSSEERLLGFGERNDEDESDYLVGDVLTRKSQKFSYVYDFGDGWGHECVIEKTRDAGDSVEPAVVLDGERACPPEDCGGVYGYDTLLRTVADPEAEEHQEMRQWLGEFDPEHFDKEAVNQRLAAIHMALMEQLDSQEQERE